MVKRIITVTLICLVVVLSLTGCTSDNNTISVNVENDNTISGNTFGKSTLIEIGSGLWYDTTTRIVYWWNGGAWWGQNAMSPSPYYAPNGLPYRYNPETNTFEEIKEEL